MNRLRKTESGCDYAGFSNALHGAHVKTEGFDILVSLGKQRISRCSDRFAVTCCEDGVVLTPVNLFELREVCRWR